ncbi:twin-arginine translocation signal domain-containing protein [Pararobbsia alpina]|uniref:Uncharacterized protein n=1 Tax=Pararobbsia alpina TaxID=621374 RepID=A0A6S7BWM2_9BURK|nr:twin-arginine translocation signal domain-containing protein [Pararobbsia alpina]CAB3806075.1 hypothetical protein LMG28138_05757 [Pararobbsia alpina]
MTVQLTRRDLLKRGSGLLGVAAVGGSQYGIGMDWVGKLVEAVTDQSLEVYFREHIGQFEQGLYHGLQHA